MKILAIVQARMGSTRLPGKVMMHICGKTVLELVVNRLKKVPSLNDIVIATTLKQDDDILVNEAVRLGVPYFRGDEEHVLSRYYNAASQNKADTVVRITSDCPLIDPEVSQSVIRHYLENDYDYVSNTIKRSFPRGLDTEVFSMEALEAAYENAYTLDHKEHVTPYIYQHLNQFLIGQYIGDVDYSTYRWTLDTPEDYKLIVEIYRFLNVSGQDFSWKNVIRLMKDRPYLSQINAHIKQKTLAELHSHESQVK